MTKQQIRSHLTTLKIHIDQIDDWVRQATDLVYAIEEGLLDSEDRELYKIYEKRSTIDFFKETATNPCPPRLEDLNRCGADSSAAVGFYQS